MQVHAWMEFPLSISRIWLLKYCFLLPNKYRGHQERARVNLQCNKPSSKHTNTQIKIPIQHNDIELTNVHYMLLQTWNLLALAPCFTFLKIMKRWSRWSSKAEVQQRDTCPEPTELRFIGHLTQHIWDPNQVLWLQEPTRRHTDRRQFHTWWVEPSYMFVQYPHLQVSPVPRSDVENNATRNRRRKHCGKVEADDELGFEDWQALQLRRVRVHQVARRSSEHKAQGNLHLKNKSKWLSVGFSIAAIRTFKQVRGDLRMNVQVSSTLVQCGQTISRGDVKDIDTNSLIWTMIVSATLDAAVHFGKDYLELSTKKTGTTNGKVFVQHVTKVDHGNTKNWLVHIFGKRQLSDRAVWVSKAESLHFLRFRIVLWQNASTSGGHGRVEKWVVYRHTSLLNFVRYKTMKQWSRWSSKAEEVQQWDTCPEATELRLIGHLKESTLAQQSKSNFLTPKNQLVCWP